MTLKQLNLVSSQVGGGGWLDEVGIMLTQLSTKLTLRLSMEVSNNIMFVLALCVFPLYMFQGFQKHKDELRRPEEWGQFRAKIRQKYNGHGYNFIVDFVLPITLEQMQIFSCENSSITYSVTDSRAQRVRD